MLHQRADRGAHFSGNALPSSGQFASVAQIFGMGRRNPRRQCVEVGGGVERCQPSLPADQQARQFGRLHAILAGAGEYRLHAPLDFRQARRVEVDAVGVAAQDRNRLAEFGLR